MEPLKVLFVSPHPDDFVLQNGGALRKHAVNGDLIHIVIVSECEHLPRNAGIIEETDKLLEYIDYESVARLELETRSLFTDENRKLLRSVLEDYRELYGINIVYCPWCDDVHQDHKAVFEEVARVFRYSTVLQGFHPHSCPGFLADYFISMSWNAVTWKLGLMGLFKTQRNLSYVGWEYNETVMRFAGSEINQQYAERYKVWRLIT